MRNPSFQILKLFCCSPFPPPTSPLSSSWRYQKCLCQSFSKPTTLVEDHLLYLPTTQMLHTLALFSAPFPQKLMRSFQLKWPLLSFLSPNHCKLRLKSCLTRALTPQCGSTWFDASLIQGKTSPHLPAASWGQEGSRGTRCRSTAQLHAASQISSTSRVVQL